MFKGILGKKGLPEKFHDEMLQNMQLMPQFGYYGGDSLKESHSVRILASDYAPANNRASPVDECCPCDHIVPSTPGFWFFAIEVADTAFTSSRSSTNPSPPGSSSSLSLQCGLKFTERAMSVLDSERRDQH
jgi:hypothetical protein